MWDEETVARPMGKIESGVSAFRKTKMDIKRSRRRWKPRRADVQVGGGMRGQ